MKDLLKRMWPYAVSILLFISISFAYFSPILQGKQLPQMDNTHAIGMAQELKQYEKATGEKSMWTNSMFSGMPAYQIKGDTSSNVFSKINQFTRLGLPFQTVAIVFLYMLGFYLLLLSFRIDNWLSVIGAIGFALGSYNIIIIIVGHITKAYAIGMMAPVIAGVVSTYNQNKYIGGLFTAVALGLEIAYNHVQITYYLALLIMIIVIAKFFYAFAEKKVISFLRTSSILLVAVILAILPNISNLLTTQEYGKFSNRGPSELTTASTHKLSTGLDKDYAFAWSYGKKETWTVMVPNVVGGASRALGDNETAMETINNNVSDKQLKDILSQQFTQYWGGRGFTEGPVYFGAIICFLFLLGAFYYKGKDRWWLIAGTVLSLFLAWGKNLEWFNDFMFYYFPLYNKFRTVEMALVIASVTVPILGFLGLKEIFNNPSLVKNDSKWFLAAFGLTGGLSLLFYLMPTTFFGFVADMELDAINAQKQQMPQYAAAFDTILENLKLARIDMLKADAIRSFFFILLASGSIWLFSTNKLSGKYLTIGLALLIIIDMWSIDKRYLNNDHFVSKRQANSFVQSPADKAILQDKNPYYRVFAIYVDPFKDAMTPYFHKSIGGYHGAKMRRYQDLYDQYGSNEWMRLRSLLQNGYNQAVDEYLMSATMINMMNTKYIIYNPNAAPVVNPYAMGNAWFVDNVKLVKDANEEIETVGKVNIRHTAVVDEQFKNLIEGYHVDSTSGSIKLTTYKPDGLKFESSTSQMQLAVFSDIYYPKGWKAFIDGKEVDIFRANYILRALMIPAGEHSIEFKFEPQSYKIGKMIGYAGSAVILVLIGFFIFYLWKHKED